MKKTLTAEEMIHHIMKDVSGGHPHYLIVVGGDAGVHEMVHSTIKSIPPLLGGLIAQVAKKTSKTGDELMEEIKPWIKEWESEDVQNGERKLQWN